MPGLFSLAREIRDEIFHHALVSPKDLVIFSTEDHPAFCCCDTILVDGVGPKFFGEDGNADFTNQIPSAEAFEEAQRYYNDGKGYFSAAPGAPCRTNSRPHQRVCSLRESLPEHEKLDQWHPSVALLRTCRQFYEEALPILYSDNRFFFDERALDNDRGDLSAPQRISAPEVCFDFLSSLPMSTLRLIRKLKFRTDMQYWNHGRVFDFISRMTGTEDVEIHFFGRHKPGLDDPGLFNVDVRSLPWVDPADYGEHSRSLQADALNIYSLCQLNGLRRLATKATCCAMFEVPISNALTEHIAKSRQQIVNIIGLLRSKMLSEEAIQATKPFYPVVRTSITPNQIIDGVTYIWDEFHSEDVEPDYKKYQVPESPFPPTPDTRGSPTGDDSAQFPSRVEVHCLHCGETDWIIRDIDTDSPPWDHEVLGPSRNYDYTDLRYASWPDDLERDEFWVWVANLYDLED